MGSSLLYDARWMIHLMYYERFFYSQTYCETTGGHNRYQQIDDFVSIGVSNHASSYLGVSGPATNVVFGLPSAIFPAGSLIEEF